MQQTEKYQLNLIETSDLFSPAPLNENAQKLETALESGLAAVRAEAAAGVTAEAQARANAVTAEANARASAVTAEANARASAVTAEANARAAKDAALEQRIVSLEGHKFAGGTYVGNSEGSTTFQFINLGFTPQVVILSAGPSKYAMLRRGAGADYHKIVNGGFQVGNMTSDYWNYAGTTYPYIAIG